MARTFKTTVLVVAAGAALTACATARGPAPQASGGGGTMRPYQVNGVWYRPRAEPSYDQKGLASWYGHESRSRTTADGEIFDTGQVTGAHKTLPLPSIVEVTNLDNGRRIRVRLNDRGPFAGGRIIDLTPAAAKELDFYGKGMAHVRVRYVGPAPLTMARGAVRQTRVQARIEPQPQPQPQPQAPVQIAAAAPPAVVTTPTPSCRVQAGAFVDLGNAQRVVERLSGQGGASIETVDRGGAPLYRVMVGCAAGAS